MYPSAAINIRDKVVMPGGLIAGELCILLGPDERAVFEAEGEWNGAELATVILLDNEMLVRSGGEAGITRFGDDLSCLHMRAGVHPHALQFEMGIFGHGAVVVQDAHGVGAGAVFD